MQKTSFITLLFIIGTFLACGPNGFEEEQDVKSAGGKSDVVDRDGDQIDPGFEQLPKWKQDALRQLKATYGIMPRFRFDPYLDNNCKVEYVCVEGSSSIMTLAPNELLDSECEDYEQYIDSSYYQCQRTEDKLVCEVTPCAESNFIGLLPRLTAYMNDLVHQNGYSFTVLPAEAALTFIMEGGYFVLQSNQIEGIDGYNDIGVDTLVSNYANTRRWLHPMIQTLVSGNQQTGDYTNEQGQSVSTLYNLTLEEAMYANAGMFVYYKAVLASFLKNRGVNINTLPPKAQFFWSSMFYNAGAGTAGSIYRKYGLNFYRSHWKKTDSFYDHFMSPKYNATVRIAQIEYLSFLCSANAIEPGLCQGLPRVAVHQ